MPDSPPSSAAGIFSEALSRPDHLRPMYVVEACREDVGLLAEVRALLNAHETAPEDFLSEPVGEAIAGENLGETLQCDGLPIATDLRRGPLHPGGGEMAGDMIGPYKLLQEIGEGGFGTVWMADQAEPVTRRVALKVIKIGMDTREVMARFEAERQALAMMDDPNIAKVLDAGATDKGRPFFVMELVKGVPITQYCDEAGLSTRERLALFGDVCSAINHAHQKGIIHRDIKPSNVMVTLHGDRPVVKVIDFGIAKATQGKLTDKTLFTRFEQIVGTPVYMSPEQASMSGLDVDTRSDIYALGVLLYELLAGTPPFDASSLFSAGYEEMRRIIREDEPPKPSLRLSTVAGEERVALAKARKVTPEKLRRLVAPDLDLIVMKAIDKVRARRYETANAFAQDISAFLSDEPVSATPPSAGYKFRKFARRNKAALRVAASIALLLVSATAVSTWQAWRATEAEKRTAETLKEVAAERDAKEQALEDAEAVTTFLAETFRNPDPVRDGRTITMAEMLDTAAKYLETELTGQPRRRARLQMTLASTYSSLGLYQQAIPLKESVRDYTLSKFGSEHPATLAAMSSLADSHCESGHRDKALEMREEILKLCRHALDPEDSQTVGAMAFLGYSYHVADRREEALVMREEVLALERERYGPDHQNTIAAIGNLSQSYKAADRPEEALALQKEMLKQGLKVLGKEHPLTLQAMDFLAQSFDDARRWDEALELREEVLALRRQVLGPEHSDTLNSMGRLARSYGLAKRDDQALKLVEEALALTRKTRGPRHPATVAMTVNVAEHYRATGRHAKALTMHEETLPLCREVYGPEHANTIAALACLANSYFHAERHDDAIKLYNEALQLHQKVHGPEHQRTLRTMQHLLRSYIVTGQKEKAARMRAKLLENFTPGEKEAHKRRVRYLEKGGSSPMTKFDRAILNAMQFWRKRLDDPRVIQLYESGLTFSSIVRRAPQSWSVNLSGIQGFKDLALIEGMKIGALDLGGTDIVNLSALRSLPLVKLSLTGCPNLRDLSPLADIKTLEELVIPPGAEDIGFLRELPNLTRLSFTKGKKGRPDKTAEEFWEEYDPGITNDE